MKNHFIHIKLLFKRLFVIYIAFLISRLFFLSFNYSYFADNNIIELFKIFSIGSLFDGVPIIVFNAIFILLHLLPFNFRNNKNYQKLIFILFILVNSILLLANFIDIEYFKFTNKRTTFDVFSLIFTGDDIGVLIPQFLKDFWFIILLWISLIAIMTFIYPKIKNPKSLKFNFANTLIQTIIAIVLFSSFIVLTRGLGLRPVGIATAARYTKSDNIPLLLNTPFTILKTIGKRDLQKKEYFTTEELHKLFNPVKEYKTDTSFRKMNVVIIILESFGKDYTGFYNNKPYTPFLDSLIRQSLSFKYSFANGKKSMEAVPAIISSLPALSDNPYILSQYSTDDTYGLAEILKDQGYYTAFFHGGINGTMGFDNYALSNGFEDYIGKSEYPNDNDYDGTWGIYDEEFLQFFAKKLDDLNKPFLGTIFTLSSHHPYNVPEKYKNKFKEGSLPIHRSIAYADYSLKKFFETAKKMDWFKNTLFVLTADHTSYTESNYFGNKFGMYNIPILYYAPGKIAAKQSEKITQQIDIMPSVLDFLNYNKQFYSFGNSVFRNENGYSVNYISGVYQYIHGDFTYLFDGDNSVALYNFKTDSLLYHNLVNNKPQTVSRMNIELKSIIQTYNNNLIDNKLTSRKTLN